MIANLCDSVWGIRQRERREKEWPMHKSQGRKYKEQEGAGEGAAEDKMS